VSDRLVDSKVVAAELGVPHTWIEAQARAEAIPHVHLGRYVRYDLAEVRDWVKSLKAGGGPAYRRHRPGNVA
jgi:predicted DNA-binding transcriptional regulator AlpA